jgi:hypothetical protein
MTDDIRKRIHIILLPGDQPPKTAENTQTEPKVSVIEWHTNATVKRAT